MRLGQSVAIVAAGFHTDAATGLQSRLRAIVEAFTLALMPAYVFRYNNLEGPFIVDYDDNAGWRMEARFEAEMHCDTLQRHSVYVGVHYCDFSVVELEGKFAIVCASHPAHLRHAKVEPVDPSQTKHAPKL